MALRFRKTIKIAPGLKLNLGKKSASIRIGGKNAGYTIGTAGTTTSASLPGTGLGVTVRNPRKKQPKAQPPAQPPMIETDDDPPAPTGVTIWHVLPLALIAAAAGFAAVYWLTHH